jgi:hypothetical protein
MASQTDDCDMQAEAEVPQACSMGRRSPVLWWQLVLIACAVVVASSSVVIARSEMRQADYLRRANCAARAQAGGTGGRPGTGDVEAELRRCLGLLPRNLKVAQSAPELPL